MEPSHPTGQRPRPNFAEKTCPGCGRSFQPTGARQTYHSVQCRNGHADRDELGRRGVSRRMAAGPEVGDSAGAKERKAAGVAQAGVERDREKEALKGLKKLAAQTVERAADHGTLGEQQMLQRIRALGAAKRAGDWAGIEHALIDVAACALSWAARIGHAEGEERLPVLAVSEPVVEDAPLNGSSKSIAERYADVLLAAAELDLAGADARATIERLLGVGL